MADPLDVQAGLAVACLGRLAEPVHDVQLRGAQLGGAFADALLEHLVELRDARALSSSPGAYDATIAVIVATASAVSGAVSGRMSPAPHAKYEISA